MIAGAKDLTVAMEVESCRWDWSNVSGGGKWEGRGWRPLSTYYGRDWRRVPVPVSGPVPVAWASATGIWPSLFPCCHRGTATWTWYLSLFNQPPPLWVLLLQAIEAFRPHTIGHRPQAQRDGGTALGAGARGNLRLANSTDFRLPSKVHLLTGLWQRSGTSNRRLDSSSIRGQIHMYLDLPDGARRGKVPAHRASFFAKNSVRDGAAHMG
jgi:hypothetical protein